MRKRLTERWRRLGRTARILLAAGVAAVMVGGGGAGAWALARKDTTQSQTMTVQASSGTVKQTVSASGTVEAAESADLTFEVSGTVTKVRVAEGDVVKKGQALAEVDDESLIAARTAAKSALTAAEEQYETDQDAGASDVQLASDEAAVVSAEADLDSAREAVEDAVLRSTISGTVTAFDIEVGDTVGSSSSSSSSSGSGDSGAGGGAMPGGTGSGSDSSSDSSSGDSSGTVTVVSTDTFVVEATVSADDASEVKKGLQATLTLNGAEEDIYGTVSTVGKVAESSSTGAAVFPVTIAVTGEVEDVYPGTSVTAAITVEQRENVLTVNSAAIRTESDKTYVDKVVDGKAVKTEVTIGEVYGATTEITKGLEDGDSVEMQGFTRPAGRGSGGGGEGGQGGQGGLPGGGELPEGFQGGGGFPGGGGGFPGGGGQ
ncbi:efflux RND transporter periplasmic adaptor subunit [Nocardioides sp. NPDC058538]|uniref:efflux RND transporter periplasmic adaptor subunit n=1 Tax=Nocardioides sp. NPDC058538 TaxID=3346542 RepID=UPI00364662FE